jgi:hypothetical protein
MDKKELSVLIAFIGLTVLFSVAAAALYLSKGNSKFWTAKKMKFGALLLTITAATTVPSCEGETTTCYETARMENEIRLDQTGNEIDLKSANEIKGKIEYRTAGTYSYLLKNDSLSEIKFKGLLIPVDGTFNDSTEAFTIPVDTGLPDGNYTLSFYDTTVNEQRNSLADYRLVFKK